MIESARALLGEQASVFQRITDLAPLVAEAGQMIADSIREGHTLYLCGNGGSAADAQHLAAEFLGRFLIERRPLPAHALTTNSSILTAIANDYGYDQVFSRQITGLGQPGDVLIGISTSGKSRNVVNAFDAARERGVKLVAFTGEQESPMSARADIAIRVPSSKTPRIQEMHIAIGHTICELVENTLA